eukprot:1778599-Pyramimonas_sp.AAC.1
MREEKAMDRSGGGGARGEGRAGEAEIGEHVLLVGRDGRGREDEAGPPLSDALVAAALGWQLLQGGWGAAAARAEARRQTTRPRPSD